MINHGIHGTHENKAPESVRGLLKKIHALSERGVGGEAEVAKLKLEKLLEKYNLSMDDILSDETRYYRLYYRTSVEEQLIVQCYVSLGIDEENESMMSVNRRGRKVKCLELKMTLAQYVDLKFMVAYYKTAWKKEMDTLLCAFVQKHRLYRPNVIGKTDHEKNVRILTMMRGLSEKSYFKPAGLIEQ